MSRFVIVIVGFIKLTENDVLLIGAWRQEAWGRCPCSQSWEVRYFQVFQLLSVTAGSWSLHVSDKSVTLGPKVFLKHLSYIL